MAAAVDRRDWISHRWLVPSWLLSLLVHGGTIALIVAWMPPWQSAPVGFSDEPFREVGILVQHPSETMAATDEPASTENSSPEAVPADVPQEVAPPTTVAPSLPTSIASEFTPVPSAIGIGAALPPAANSHPRDLIQPGSSAAQALQGGIPGTAFMGIRDNASRVVFVIDSSASMFNHHAMQAAKAALISSLQTLTDSQQFQVIFYNDRPQLLGVPDRRDPTLAFATEVNKVKARQEIAAVTPDRGTNHLDALKLAMRLGPEVIYLLTDADEPQLTAAELNQIDRTNQGRARIHCIEFGVGAALANGPQNFLQKLARQNGGTYRYHDVKRMDLR